MKKKEIAYDEQEVARYSAMIRKKIGRYWHYSLSGNKKIHAVVQLILNSMGEIISVSLTTSSGSDIFDKSVLYAVKYAAPFDFLSKLNIRLFEINFRKINLNFSPQDVM